MTNQTTAESRKTTHKPDSNHMINSGGITGDYDSPTGIHMPMSIALENPSALSPDNIQQLQSSLGNQFVMRMMADAPTSQPNTSFLKGFTGGNKIQRSTKVKTGTRYGKIQRADDLLDAPKAKENEDLRHPPPALPELMSGDEYRSGTNSSFFSKRGDTSKGIEKSLREYHTLRDIEDKIFRNESALGMDLKRTREGILEQLQIMDEHIRQWMIKHKGEAKVKRLAPRWNTVNLLNSQIQRRLTDYRVLVGTSQQRTILGNMQGLINSGTQDSQPYANMTPQEREKFALNQAIEQTDAENNPHVKELRTKFEGSPNEFYTNFLKRVYDILLPGVGEGKAEVQFRFPVDPTGTAYIGGRLYTKAERYSAEPKADAVKAESEAVIQVGGGIANVVDLNGEIGGFKEVKAANTREIAQLMSYSSYRRWKESSLIPRELTSKLWGGSGGLVGYNKAEKWAADIEKSIFGDDVKDAKKKYVIDAFTGNVNLKAGGMIGFSEKLRMGKRYTKATLGDRLGQPKEFTGKRGADKSKAQDIIYNAIKFAVSTTFGGGEFEMKNQWRDVPTVSDLFKKKNKVQPAPQIEQAVEDASPEELDEMVQQVNEHVGGDQPQPEAPKEEPKKKDPALTDFLGADFTAMKGTFYLKVPYHKAAGPSQAVMIAGIITESLDSIKALHDKYASSKKGKGDEQQKNAAIAHSLGSAVTDGVGLGVQLGANLETASVAWKNLDELKSQIGGSVGLQLQIAYENEAGEGKWKIRLNHDQQIKGQALAGPVKVFSAKWQQDTNIFAWEKKVGEDGKFVHLNAALTMTKFVKDKVVDTYKSVTGSDES